VGNTSLSLSLSLSLSHTHRYKHTISETVHLHLQTTCLLTPCSFPLTFYQRSPTNLSHRPTQMTQPLDPGTCTCQPGSDTTPPPHPLPHHETRCNCRCSCACQVSSEEDGDEDSSRATSDGETLVDDNFLEGEDEWLSPAPESEYYPDSESSLPSPSARDLLEAVPLREFLFGGGAGGGYGYGFREEGWSGSVSESLYNEPYESGEHSSAVSERGSRRVTSPGPGICGGSEDVGMGFRYYFVVVPLRLSPQLEHCRGQL
jgi:hypothetical protein